MTCKHFGVCNSCNNYEGGFEAQNLRKQVYVKTLFDSLYKDSIQFYASIPSHYRARSEFRIWHEDETIHYALNSVDKAVMFVTECPKVATVIEGVMFRLLERLQTSALKHKLFAMDFLSSSTGELCVSFLYHKKIDDQMIALAKVLEVEFGIAIILRARKQKVVLSRDYVIESLHVKAQDFRFKHIENSFTQPNAYVNEKMIAYAMDAFEGIGGDLLELYCGAGNFTIPFATIFDKVLATEISKSSIKAAQENMQLNNIENIEFIRMSAEEFCEAMDKKREFRRMAHIDIDAYALKSIFVDPPRAGLDTDSLDFVSRFEHIVYISCNPETLQRDLTILTQTHTIESMAAFDQFVYTKHIEMGVKLTKR